MGPPRPALYRNIAPLAFRLIFLCDSRPARTPPLFSMSGVRESAAGLPGTSWTVSLPEVPLWMVRKYLFKRLPRRSPDVRSFGRPCPSLYPESTRSRSSFFFVLLCFFATRAQLAPHLHYSPCVFRKVQQGQERRPGQFRFQEVPGGQISFQEAPTKKS
ncbi:unnamed protein product [Prorocentrum cordatum]|uniref:Uncharacterized protein n=1 Tax=Prorocentrum cordatum TaxID=2364126 RepID=A0ABN9QGP6_9DINO|nr:unnamed protein product [Polarella glacialis]